MYRYTEQDRAYKQHRRIQTDETNIMTDNNDKTTETVPVDDELVEAVGWASREIQEAHRALWDGKTGKAFASIEAAQDEMETLEEAILDE